MAARSLILFAASCILLASLHSVNYAQQPPVSPGRENLSLSDVHDKSLSKCDLCHPQNTDMNNSASYLKSDVCLSCHADFVSRDQRSILRSNDRVMINHPIKFSPRDFDPEKINHNIIENSGQFFISGPTGDLPLYGSTEDSAVAECSTCHDPHGDSGHQKLRRLTRLKGKLCRVCHVGSY
jgi:predicted CXXCH cytochrome family protein